MNELVHVFRDFFDLHLEEFRFLDAAKAFKNMVVFLNDAGELGDNRNEIKSKMEFLQSRVPLMNFEEVQGVSAILLYVKRRLAATDDGPRYGEGLSREPTAEEKAGYRPNVIRKDRVSIE